MLIRLFKIQTITLKFIKNVSYLIKYRLTKSNSGEEAKTRGFVAWLVFFLSLQGPLAIFQDSFSYTSLSVDSAREEKPKATEIVRKPILSKLMDSPNILSRLILQKEMLKHFEESCNWGY